MVIKQKNSCVKLLAALLLAIPLMGCETMEQREQNVNSKEVRFLTQTPEKIKTAFVTAGSVWMIPSKGVKVLKVTDGIRGLKTRREGVYLITQYTSERLYLQFDDGTTALLNTKRPETDK
jgi:hypothetical protein